MITVRARPIYAPRIPFLELILLTPGRLSSREVTMQRLSLPTVRLAQRFALPNGSPCPTVRLAQRFALPNGSPCPTVRLAQRFALPARGVQSKIPLSVAALRRPRAT